MVSMVESCSFVLDPGVLRRASLNEDERLHAVCILTFKEEEKACSHCLPILDGLRVKISSLPSKMPPFMSIYSLALVNRHYKIDSFPAGVIHTGCIPSLFTGTNVAVHYGLTDPLR